MEKNKTVLIIALVLVPGLLIALGFYFKKETLSSIGYVILIFFIIMAVRGKFRSDQKENE